MKEKHVLLAFLLLALVALMKQWRQTEISSTVVYGPPAFRGTQGQIVEIGGKVWGWTEAPEVGLSGQWVEICTQQTSCLGSELLA